MANASLLNFFHLFKCKNYKSKKYEKIRSKKHVNCTISITQTTLDELHAEETATAMCALASTAKLRNFAI